MTKFEEEAIKEAEKCGYVMAKSKIVFYEDEKGITFVDFNGTHTNFNFPWLEFAKNWHTDEEFQELLDKYSNLNDNYEKEVVRSSKLETSNLKLIAEGNGLLSDNAMLTKKVEDLKLQLQQQALPVVPEFVADYISELKEKGYGIQFGLMCSTHNAAGKGNEKAIHWKDDNAEDFARAWLDGYTVEKPQLFYLKNKITKAFLYDNGLEFGECDENCKDWKIFKIKFTQQEIDSMQTGSYELVPVEDGE